MYAGIKGKVAIVTGGATGMGRAVCLALGKSGAKVMVSTGRNRIGAEETADMIRQSGGEATYMLCDVSTEEQVENLVRQTVDIYGKLDLAFNNAGVGPDGVRLPFRKLTELPLDEFDKVVDTNFKGVFLCMKHELIQMEKQKSGVIVNNSSIGGLRMAPNFGAYGPSKAAVIAITRTAALENATAGIRVNVVCPGPTLGTELMKNSLATNPEEEQALKSGVIPMGRIGTTDEVANAVLWLFSDDSSFTTGQAITVDGGMAAM
ncbi:SDR family NAD(P)-dependent oxidoreductase [Thermodesulfobacteriota bacterium]